MVDKDYETVVEQVVDWLCTILTICCLIYFLAISELIIPLVFLQFLIFRFVFPKLTAREKEKPPKKEISVLENVETALNIQPSEIRIKSNGSRFTVAFLSSSSGVTSIDGVGSNQKLEAAIENAINRAYK